MKKICIITSSFPASKSDEKDASVFVRDIAYELANSNYEVYVITPKKDNSKNDFDKIHVHYFPWSEGDYGIGLVSLNPNNPLNLLKLISIVISRIFFTIKFVRKNKIDFCIAMWAVPSGMYTLFTKILMKKSYVVIALGSDVYKIDNYPLGRLILKKVLVNSAKLFADGYGLVKIVQDITNRNCFYLSSGRMLSKVIKNINYDKFDHSKKNFIFLGRFHESKGVDLLLSAIASLSQVEKEKSLFHFFGGGELSNFLRQTSTRLGLQNVFINNYIENDKVFSYMSQTDYVVIPSRSDSLSMVFFEAIQSQKPVIVTNIGDAAELVIKHKIGIITEPNVESITRGLSQAINEDLSQTSFYVSGLQDLGSRLQSERQNSIQNFIQSMKEF